MNAFDLANWFALTIGLAALAIYPPRVSKLELSLIASAIATLIPLGLWSNFGALLNLTFLMSSLVLLFSRKRMERRPHSLSEPLNGLGKSVLIILFLAPPFLQEAGGWLIVLGSAAKYWFLFSVAIRYSFTNSDRVRKQMALAVLAAGLLWAFKVALAFFLVILIHNIAKTRSAKQMLSLALGLGVILASAYYFLFEKLNNFLLNSVFRPEYGGDTKVLGLSDGARLNIWTHYLENTAWVGKGNYYLPNPVPPHNIFVHIAHEFGWLGLFLIGPILAFIIGVLFKRAGFVFGSFVALSLTISSIGEFPSFWVFCFVLAPILFQSSYFHRNITLRTKA